MTLPFVGLAAATTAAEQVPDLCSVVVPHPMGMIPASEVEAKAEETFPKIVEAATKWQPRGSSSLKSVAAVPMIEITGTVEDINRTYMDKGWSLGLPIVPPTREAVDRLLAGTSRRPDEVLGLIPPRMVPLTVELVAANAVMAGCLPQYLPVLIAAFEALLEPAAGWRSALTTTATTQTLVIVNGPIVSEIGIACEQGAAGKGHHANVSMGYAINLVAFNVGGSRPPTVDKSTLASPSDVVCWVFGENEAALPNGWQPLHVDLGFKQSDSVVTVMGCYPLVANVDHHSVTPEEHLRWWSFVCSPLSGGGGTAHAHCLEMRPIIAMGHEHALLLASSGWSKDDFKRAFWEEIRIPLRAWPHGCPDLSLLERYLGPLKPESKVPVTLRPEQFLLVMAGGVGKHSHYFPPFIECYPVSKQIVR